MIDIDIDLATQRLYLRDGARVLGSYAVSTARKGPGERAGSECTPRGRHLIGAMIGAGAPPNTVFVGRLPTGEIYRRGWRARFPGRDWILTRILWLSGCESGRNAGGEVDTGARYIYIHGAPDDEDFDRPASHGCVRMRNADVIELFDRVQVGTPVYIRER